MDKLPDIYRTFIRQPFHSSLLSIHHPSVLCIDLSIYSSNSLSVYLVVSTCPSFIQPFVCLSIHSFIYSSVSFPCQYSIRGLLFSLPTLRYLFLSISLIR